MEALMFQAGGSTLTEEIGTLSQVDLDSKMDPTFLPYKNSALFLNLFKHKAAYVQTSASAC